MSDLQRLAVRVRRGFRGRVAYPLFRARKRVRQWLRPWRGERTHLFVSGVQRSGTNMLMHVLERSPETDVFHEGDPRAFDQYMMRETPVVRDLARRSRARCFVIKALAEGDRIPAFLDAFENARCVWLYRHHHDVASSMLASFRSVPETVRRMAVEGERVGWWGRGMSERTRARLQELTQRSLTNHSLAALLWYVRNLLFFEAGLAADGRVLPVRYETLVTQPAAEAERVFGFAGIPFDARVTRRVNAASVRRRAAPALDEEVEALCSDLLRRLDDAAGLREAAR